MFGLFKKKSPLEKLEEQYKSVMKEAFELSKVNRSAGTLNTQKRIKFRRK